MIDDKKIDKEAISYARDGYNDYSSDMQDVIKESFKSGAEWAINEFLKDLWHPVEEEPNTGKFIFMEMRNGDNYALYFVSDEYSWECICTMFTTTSWLYIDDLLPKKRGE